MVGGAPACRAPDNACPGSQAARVDGSRRSGRVGSEPVLAPCVMLSWLLPIELIDLPGLAILRGLQLTCSSSQRARGLIRGRSGAARWLCGGGGGGADMNWALLLTQGVAQMEWSAWLAAPYLADRLAILTLDA